MEQLEDNHRIEVRIYIQKVKHLEYEHKNNMRKVRSDGDVALDEEKSAHFGREKQLKDDKKAFRVELIERELKNEEFINEWKERHNKKMLKMRQEFEKTLSETDSKYVAKVDKLRTEIDALMTEKLLELTPERVRNLLEEVIRTHLGWLVVWGNVFGSLIGLVSTMAGYP